MSGATGRAEELKEAGCGTAAQLRDVPMAMCTGMLSRGTGVCKRRVKSHQTPEDPPGQMDPHFPSAFPPQAAALREMDGPGDAWLSALHKTLTFGLHPIQNKCHFIVTATSRDQKFIWEAMKCALITY